ncbi:MAG: hypothetical protein LBK41_04200, partial [Clostridiales bacterium]|nr:hypothetical protein [Clostridiales bacterium]
MTQEIRTSFAPVRSGELGFSKARDPFLAGGADSLDHIGRGGAFAVHARFAPIVRKLGNPEHPVRGNPVVDEVCEPLCE